MLPEVRQTIMRATIAGVGFGVGVCDHVFAASYTFSFRRGGSMMRKLVVLGFAATLLGGAAAPALACSPIDVCVNFTLSNPSANQWTLTANWVSGHTWLTHVALYADSGQNLGTPTFGSVTVAGWGQSTNTDYFPAGKVRVIGASGGGLQYPSKTVIIAFSSSVNLFALTGLGTHASFADGDWDNSPDCLGGGGLNETVPEPVSLVLLGTGLLGIGGVRIRRRQK